jgi:fibronectin type III domain protein
VSDRPGGPEFDEEFWRVVHRRAERVRELVLNEIEQAEHLVFSEGEVVKIPAAATSEENVVPVFTEPFWEEVGVRAHRVRNLASETLAAAEERLLNDQEVLAPVALSTKRTGTLRNLVRNLPIQRSDAFGFVAALLAAVLLVPQLIAPVMSSAGVQPPKILQFMIIGDKDRKDQLASELEGEGGSTNGSAAQAETDSDGNPVDGTPSSSQGAGAKGTDSVSGPSEGGTSGTPAAGAAGQGQSGASDASPAASPSPSAAPSPAVAAPKPPTAPLEVHAVGVDSKTIRVTWTDISSDETGFQVNREVPDGAPASTERVEKDVTSFVVLNLVPETRACFRVRALNEAGHSDWAPSLAPGYACATTPAAPAETPGQPAGSPAPQPEASPAAAPPPA